MILPPCFRAHVAFDDLSCGRQTGIVLATLPLDRTDPTAAAVLLDHHLAGVVWIVPLIELDRIASSRIARPFIAPTHNNE